MDINEGIPQLSKDNLAVARLRDSTLVVSKQVVDIAFEDDASTFVARLNDIGSDSAWTFLLHSASNAYGWASFSDRRCVRYVFGSFGVRILSNDSKSPKA